MSVAYRDGALPCPGCAELLVPTSAGESVIDLCPACAGVWVDWDDGELTSMIKSAPSPRPPARPVAGGSFSCPRCRAPLVNERYGTSEAEILRCSECIGAFVPHAAIALLLVGAAPSTRSDAEKGFLERLLDRLRALTGASS
ncbi:MAG: zf-TFIIB domain-containing protein [Minicystis sp.]